MFSLIINTFAAVVGLYIRDRTFFFPHFYCAFILLSYLWESIFNFSFMKKYFPIPLIIILWIGLSLWSCNQPLSQKEKSSATFDSIHVEKNIPSLRESGVTRTAIWYSNSHILRRARTKPSFPSYRNNSSPPSSATNTNKLTPQEAINRYTEDYLANYKELEETFRKDLEANEKAGCLVFLLRNGVQMLSNTTRTTSSSYTVSFEKLYRRGHMVRIALQTSQLT